MKAARTVMLLMIGCVLGLAPGACDRCDCGASGAKARAPDGKTGDECDCFATDDDTPSTPADARGEPDEKYIVRGRVKMVPVKDKPQTEFVAHHEAIPDFKRLDGKLGMNEMSMPFPPAKNLDLSEIAVGDIVEIEFVVWSQPGKLDMETRRVTKLPADTVLRLKGE